MRILAVIDMQNDFISGSLGTPEAESVVPRVVDKIKDFDGRVIFTRDTHESGYLSTAEGRALPVTHCVRRTPGWELHPAIDVLRTGQTIIDKPAFGSAVLGELIKKLDDSEGVESVTLVGLCTDICVISNALLIKAFIPEAEIIVDSSCCAGVTPESHERALGTMRMGQINVR